MWERLVLCKSIVVEFPKRVSDMTFTLPVLNNQDSTSTFGTRMIFMHVRSMCMIATKLKPKKKKKIVHPVALQLICDLVHSERKNNELLSEVTFDPLFMTVFDNSEFAASHRDNPQSSPQTFAILKDTSPNHLCRLSLKFLDEHSKSNFIDQGSKCFVMLDFHVMFEDSEHSARFFQNHV